MTTCPIVITVNDLPLVSAFCLPLSSQFMGESSYRMPASSPSILSPTPSFSGILVSSLVSTNCAIYLHVFFFQSYTSVLLDRPVIQNRGEEPRPPQNLGFGASMSLGHNAWPPSHIRPPDESQDLPRPVNGLVKTLSGSRTPQILGSVSDGPNAASLISEADIAVEEDPRVAQFRNLYRCSEVKINTLFSGQFTGDDSADPPIADVEQLEIQPERVDAPEPPSSAPKKTARKLDDDYDDYDEDEDVDIGSTAVSPLKAKSVAPPQDVTAAGPEHRPSTANSSGADGAKEPKKETLEEIRKQLEEDKKATEEAAKRSFHTLFYTLENDRDAMLDQQRLEESERLVEAEMSSQANAGGQTAAGGLSGYGSLSNTNLGASSLTLKNLIARIDTKRAMVRASDAELRSLLSEVRKNRSKWASEDKVGQEELYEAAEKVLSELKAMTEHSTAFLTRVNKRDAPDYYSSKTHFHLLYCLC